MSVGWVKIQTDMFQNRKIKQIESLPRRGDAILVIWCKLICLAGQINDGGRIYITKGRAYDSESLSVELNKDTTVVEDALEVLLSYGMIEYIDDILTISNWCEYQNIEGMERVKEQNRIRKQKQREREKAVPEPAPQKPEKPKEVKHKYGSFKNVLLTDAEYEKLKEKFNDIEERIERLSLYISSSGKSYKSHYATILSWAKKDEKEAGSSKEKYYETMTKFYGDKNKKSFYTENRGTDYDKLFGSGVGA